MAVGDITIGRRVASIDDLEAPGDYYLSAGVADEELHGSGAGGPARSLWFVLPTAESVDPFVKPRNPHNGRHRIAEPPWTFRECPDGSLEARDSIACGMPVYWHGFLDEGHVWRQV